MDRNPYRMTWWQQIMALVFLAVVFSLVFALGSLLIHGHVDWGF
jgi:hypothetical protein